MTALQRIQGALRLAIVGRCLDDASGVHSLA